MDYFLKASEWEKRIRYITKLGFNENKQPICEHCGRPTSTRDFAHLDRTGQKSTLQGEGRGSSTRVRDFVKHYNDYGLLCEHCHKNHDLRQRELEKISPKVAQKFLDGYPLPYPDKKVRKLMHELKKKRQARAAAMEMKKPAAVNAGGKVYLKPGEKAPKGKMEQTGTRGGRFYEKQMESNMLDKNLHKSEVFKNADPFNNVFRKGNQVNIDGMFMQKPEEMGKGGQAIEALLNMPLSQIESLVKAEQTMAKPGKRGKRVYVAPDEAAPPGVPMYRGKHGGRFYMEPEKEEKEEAEQKTRDLQTKVSKMINLIEKEFNNLGNVKPRNPVNKFQPDLPQNQGVFKGGNLVPAYNKNPQAPAFDMGGKNANIKPPKLEKGTNFNDAPAASPDIAHEDIYSISSNLGNKGVGTVGRASKKLIDPEQHNYVKNTRPVHAPKIEKQDNPFAIATAQAKKEGYKDFKEGTAGEKRVDEISEAIKRKSLSNKISKYISKQTKK